MKGANSIPKKGTDKSDHSIKTIKIFKAHLTPGGLFYWAYLVKGPDPPFLINNKLKTITKK
jgi:hypothetical protein